MTEFSISQPVTYLRRCFFNTVHQEIISPFPFSSYADWQCISKRPSLASTGVITHLIPLPMYIETTPPEVFLRVMRFETNEAQTSFLNQLRDVWKSDQTLFRVFDIAS